MYYVLEEIAEHIIVGAVEETESYFSNKYTEGRRLEKEEHPIDLRVSVEEIIDPFPDYFELQQIPIVSQNFIKSLQASGVDNFEIYPAKIEDYEEINRIDGHYILNIVGRISCLDRSGSFFTEDSGVIFRILKLAIDENRASKGGKLFRLHEYEYIILLDETVKQHMSNLTGFQLIEANIWENRRY